MGKLCKIFKSTNTVKYQGAWKKAEKNPPMIPYVGDVLTRVLKSQENVDNEFEKLISRSRIKRKPAAALLTQHKRWNFSAAKLNNQ